ncbi:histamine H2 receptor-like [Copidosoma floridanum]|uniref:histamine H2 receptor-like n=1 Tax=Copidosoma floridanum TaxID=29053 RepID=UPI0006C94A01|nr:histamine H2 receptor-like [Copidosoma floridanum]XP_023246763.1 histamine H2 receptor-like [Copidosoma floridanum]
MVYTLYTNPYTYIWLSYVLLIVVIITGNVLTIISQWLNRKIFRVTSNYLIHNLAIADLFCGLALLYNTISRTDEVSKNKIVCLLRFAFQSGSCIASFYSVVTIAIDRYVSILYPLEYPEYITERKIFTMISLIWGMSILLSTVPLYWNTYADSCHFYTVIPRCYIEGVWLPNFLVVWLSVLIFYWRIWKTARAFAQRSKERSRVIGSSHHHRMFLDLLAALRYCFSGKII